jgi:ribosomal protein S18 acetylase RimI-like enzyme
MIIRSLISDDLQAATVLWESAGLTRPWNPPEDDLERALIGPSSTVLGCFHKQGLIGTVMTGHDGHRGWVYYLSVADRHRRSGVGTRLMAAAEAWLREEGAVKVQLMVRSTNEQVTEFYDRLGYEDADVQVLAKWLR